MVQMGRIMTAQKSNPDRADLIAINAKKKIEESYEKFHYRLDDIEVEIVSLAARVLLSAWIATDQSNRWTPRRSS